MKNIATYLEKQAATVPDKIAFTVIAPNGKIDNVTFGELEERVEAFARYLYEKVNLEKSFMLLYEQNIEVVVAFLACIKIGVIPIPMEIPVKNKSIQKWENVAVDANTGYILTNTSQTEMISQIFGASEVLSNIPIMCENEGGKEYKKGENNIALLQYTSGSTGIAKGVIISNTSLMENMECIREKWGFNENSVMVSWLPYYHDMGLILGILEGIYVGHRVVLMAPNTFMNNPYIWIKAISDYKGTHIAAPNFAYAIIDNIIEKMDEKHIISFNSLEKAICGSEPVNLNTMLHFLKTAKTIGVRENVLSPGYGLAEATLVVSSYEKMQEVGWLEVDRRAFESNHVVIKGRGNLKSDMKSVDELSSESIFIIGNGFAINRHKITIRNEDGKVVGPLELGEICFSGVSLTDGYWKKKEATENIFGYDNGEKYLRTGDLGLKDSNDELYITGRIKDLIIIRGMNYYPQDIEKVAASSHMAFKMDGTAAFSIYNDTNEKLVIVQEIRHKYEKYKNCEDWGNSIRINVLQACNIEVGDIIFVMEGNVPKTGSGKIQRQRAKKLYLMQEFTGVLGNATLEVKDKSQEKIENLDDLKNSILEIVSGQIGISSSRIDEAMTFNEMGVNSMLSLVIIEELEKIVNCKISAVSIYNYNTINQLANYIWGLLDGCEEELESDDYTSDEIVELLEKEIGGDENVE